MAKHAISVTLSASNLTWLRGRVAAAGHRSVSDLLDTIVEEARTTGGVASGVRSVAGTIDIADDDPDLATADGYVSALFQSSVGRPVVARERTEYGRRAPKAPRGKRRG